MQPPEGQEYKGIESEGIELRQGVAAHVDLYQVERGIGIGQGGQESSGFRVPEVPCQQVGEDCSGYETQYLRQL